MKTVSINVVNHCIPCENHCRYCLLSWCGKLSGVDYERSESYARRFHEYIRQNRPELSFVFYFGYSMEHPSLAQAVRFLGSIGSPGGEFLQFDGMRHRTETELRVLLRELMESGIRTIDLTFYGIGEVHDRFAGRSGDYDQLMLIWRVANELSLSVNVGMPLTTENAAQADAFLTKTDALQAARRYFFVPHSEGRGKTLGPIRLTKAAFDAMSPRAKAFLSRTRFRTESEWLQDGNFAVPERRMLLLSLTKDNIDRLEKEDPAKTILDLEAMDDRYYAQIPPLSVLAARYGNKNGDRFFSERDLYLHYQAKYIEEMDLDIYDVNDERQSGSRRF